MQSQALAEPQLTDDELDAQIHAELEALIARVSGELKSALLPEFAEKTPDAELRIDAMNLLTAMFEPAANEQAGEDVAYVLWVLKQKLQQESPALSEVSEPKAQA